MIFKMQSGEKLKACLYKNDPGSLLDHTIIASMCYYAISFVTLML